MKSVFKSRLCAHEMLGNFLTETPARFVRMMWIMLIPKVKVVDKAFIRPARGEACGVL